MTFDAIKSFQDNRLRSLMFKSGINRRFELEGSRLFQAAHQSKCFRTPKVTNAAFTYPWFGKSFYH